MITLYVNWRDLPLFIFNFLIFTFIVLSLMFLCQILLPGAPRIWK